MELTVALAITILNCVIGVVSFALNRKDKAIKDAKDNDNEMASSVSNIAVFNNEIKNVKDDIKEIKDDMKDIKKMFMTYKEDIRETAKEVVYDMIQLEMKNHIEKYHSK